MISSSSGLGCMDLILLILPRTTGESLPHNTGYLASDTRSLARFELKIEYHGLNLETIINVMYCCMSYWHYLRFNPERGDQKHFLLLCSFFSCHLSIFKHLIKPTVVKIAEYKQETLVGTRTANNPEVHVPHV